MGKGTKADRVHRPARSLQERVDELEDRVRLLLVELSKRPPCETCGGVGAGCDDCGGSGWRRPEIPA